MPFCSQCGNQVGAADVFCAKCGARQPVGARTGGDPLASLSPKTASMLCYIPVVGWIGAIIVLASDRFRQDQRVRFHAFQGLYLFVAWLVVNQVLRPVWQSLSYPVIPLDKILEGAIMVAWIVMLVKTSHDEAYALPVIGELAHKSATEG
jgi:uncharacterized membrane protein